MPDQREPRGHPRQFGELPPGQEAIDRPGAYGVVRDGSPGGRILLVQWRGRYFLPGGGARRGESSRQTLARELLEETGHELLSVEPLDEAGQYLLDAATGRHVNKRCAFFRVRLGARVRDPTARDHRTTWVPPTEAVGLLHEEASAWAVQQAV